MNNIECQEEIKKLHSIVLAQQALIEKLERWEWTVIVRGRFTTLRLKKGEDVIWQCSGIGADNVVVKLSTHGGDFRVAIFERPITFMLPWRSLGPIKMLKPAIEALNSLVEVHPLFEVYRDESLQAIQRQLLAIIQQHKADTE